MPRENQKRRSAKQVIDDYSRELMNRTDYEAKVKLEAIQTIASRMGYMDLFNRIKFRSNDEVTEKWWQR